MIFLSHKSNCGFRMSVQCQEFGVSKQIGHPVLAQTLHTFYRSSPSKCKFSDFPIPMLKFTQFFISFFKQKVSFSSKFGSLFSVMRDSKCRIAENKCRKSKCKFLDLSLLASKSTKFLMFIFRTKSQFFFKICITHQCHETLLFCTFSSEILHAWDKMSSSKCKFSDFWLITWKLSKFCMSFFVPWVIYPSHFASPFTVMTLDSFESF